MKFFTVNMVILILIVAIEAESARIRRNEGSKKKSNLAVMLAYKPNSEIRTKDDHVNTWTTYRVKNENDRNVSEEELNKKLLDILVKQKFGNYEAKTINKKRHISSCESNETIDDAKVVEVKKDCYKNTYKNVLNAFEEALKSQIQSYKKCVCQKKHSTTTTTTSTSTIAPRAASSEEEKNVNLNNDQELALAIDNSNDVICFHKQYAFMLEKLLDQIPKCQEEQQQQMQLDLEVFGGDAKKRKERHNVKEINASESSENAAELKDQIMDILKEYLSAKKRENVKAPTTTTTTQLPLSKIESEENLNEEKFFEKLRNLFHQLESDDETFPVPKNNRSTHIESAASVSSSKFPKKSSNDAKARKSRRTEIRTVTEHSDESTETSIKLKKGKFGKKHSTSEELSRGDKAKSSKLSKVVKSYRTTSRSPSTTSSPPTPIPAHETNESKYYSDEEEEETSKEMSIEAQNRNVDDLAKAISDLAKKYLK